MATDRASSIDERRAEAEERERHMRDVLQVLSRSEFENYRDIPEHVLRLEADLAAARKKIRAQRTALQRLDRAHRATLHTLRQRDERDLIRSIVTKLEKEGVIE